MYTYLNASLPALRLGEPPPMTSEAFFRHCRDLVPEPERQDLAAVLDPTGSEPALTDAARTWLALEAQIRNAVAKWRAAKYRVDATGYQSPHAGYRADVAQEVSVVLAKAPLERELALDELRWRLLDELAQAGPWDFAALYAYAVKLRLAERWAGLSDEAGWVALEDFLKRNEERHG